MSTGTDRTRARRWVRELHAERRPAAGLGRALPGADPDRAPSDEPLGPPGARAATRELREVDLAANVAFVARVALYAGACDAGSGGLEGETERGGAHEARAGFYARDNTALGAMLALP